MSATGNVMRFLEQHVRENPSRVALKFEERAYTYAEVGAETDRLSRAFRENGVKQGDAVCVMMPNSPEFVFTWYALARAGAVLVPVNGEYTEDRLARLINSVNAKIVVADSRYDENLAGALEQAGAVETVIRRGAPTEARIGGRRTISFDDFHSTDSSDALLAPVRPHDPFMLMFTSGSTGEAKAVEISHGYAEHMTHQLVRYVGYNRDDTLFTCFPLFHADACLLSVLPALILGATAAVVERFSASRFWDQIRRSEATVFTAMGAVQGILLLREPSELDREHHLRITIAGAVHDRISDFEDRFGIRLVQLYGGTEFGLAAFHLDGRAAPGLLGRASDDHEIVVVDEDDRPVPTGTVGQLLVRPRVPNACMSGYYGDYAETARAWRNLWYHTGDLGYADERGVLHFVGRGKDVIRRRGRNIPPAEIETVLRSHPEIIDCAAIAVPSELIEDEVKVVVEHRSGAIPDLDEIVRLFRERLPRYMHPRYLEFVTEIPKTPTGKPAKATLRQQWRTPATIDLDNVVVKSLVTDGLGVGADRQ